MAALLLENVFTQSGVPKYTYVVPEEYTRLKVAIRTQGRGVVIEGPSGIGKTTAVTKIIEDLNLMNDTLVLSARKAGDIVTIRSVLKETNVGTIIIDDFHRLDDELKRSISDKMKVLADEESGNDKLIVIGINKAGDSLIKFSPDLNNRIDTIRFERNSKEKVLELIEKGEYALNIDIKCKEDIVINADGSFQLAQLLCHRACVLCEITEKCEIGTDVCPSVAVLIESIYEELGRTYFPIAKKFATGPKLRRMGRAPYFHVLMWLSQDKNWSIQLELELSKHPKQKAGVRQIVDKNYLYDFMKKNPDLNEYLYYDNTTKRLSVEDPKFVFYLRNTLWSKFSDQVGYERIDDLTRYDVAISFAGEDRKIAEGVSKGLSANEIAVFYDKDEQIDILTENVEEYLEPIYKSEATFVVPLLSISYPKKIWTKFESNAFRSRFGDKSVIPIWFSDVPIGMFDDSRNVGGITLDVYGDVAGQVKTIVDMISRKVLDSKLKRT